jgi:hypothetical protein
LRTGRARLAPQLVGDQVPRDRVQPRAQAPLRRVRELPAGERARERLGEDVLGQSAIEAMRGEAEDPHGVPVEHGSERRPIEARRLEQRVVSGERAR